MEFTAIVRKGDKQFVALCPELDVASQGKTIESAIQNLKEACELYIETIGVPEGAGSHNIWVTSIGVDDEASKTIRA